MGYSPQGHKESDAAEHSVSSDARSQAESPGSASMPGAPVSARLPLASLPLTWDRSSSCCELSSPVKWGQEKQATWATTWLK